MTVLTRRSLIKASLTAAGGLMLSAALPRVEADAAEGLPAPLDAWIRIGTDGTVTIVNPVAELGQGVAHALPLIVAEELRVSLEAVQVEQALASPLYGNPALFGSPQAVGDSTSVRGFFPILRRIGASGREMMIAAAAQQWGVDPSGCRAEDGQVHHDETGRSADYGALLATAASLPVPEEPALTPREQWRLIGGDSPRRDLPARTDGSADFGIDVVVEGMQIATIRHCPKLAGRLKSLDPAPALALPGVTQVVALEDAFAVVADSWWRAEKGAAALSPDWEIDPKWADLDMAKIDARMDEIMADPTHTAEQEGDLEAALEEADQVIEATYDAPFLTHATMEPMNATARWNEDGTLEVWAPTQAQTRTIVRLSEQFDLAPEEIIVHTTLLGSGFGRRSHVDYIQEAAEIARQAGTPVKLIWSREEDTRNDFFRPLTRGKFRVAVKDGKVSGWDANAIGGPIFSRLSLSGNYPFPIDGSILGYFSANRLGLYYDFPNRLARGSEWDFPVDVGPWRAVSGSQNSWFLECLMDEAAQAAGADPVAFRKAHMGDQPRLARCLDTVAEAAGWGREMPQGHGLGVACVIGFGSNFAGCVEVAMEGEDRVRIVKVWYAIDCGTAVHPPTIARQIEGGVNDAVNAAFFGEITIEEGAIVESNFDSHRWLTLAEAPAVETIILESPDAPIGGVGETGVAAAGPALLNAIFAASGRRIRSLPLVRQGLDIAV